MNLSLKELTLAMNKVLVQTVGAGDFGKTFQSYPYHVLDIKRSYIEWGYQIFFA